jgi:hypothetical protein
MIMTSRIAATIADRIIAVSIKFLRFPAGVAGCPWFVVCTVEPFIDMLDSGGGGACVATVAAGADGLACMKGRGGTWGGAESARF